MTTEHNDLVRAADGDLVRMELYQQALRDAGIESKVVGQQLEAGFGTALPRSIQLWVYTSDADKAASIIAQMEADRARPPREHVGFEHPRSDRRPQSQPAHGPHTHYDADPHS